MKSILVIAALAMTFAASAQGTNEAATAATATKAKVAKKAAKKVKKTKKEEKKSTSSLDNVEGQKVAMVKEAPIMTQTEKNEAKSAASVSSASVNQSTTTVETAKPAEVKKWGVDLALISSSDSKLAWQDAEQNVFGYGSVKYTMDKNNKFAVRQYGSLTVVGSNSKAGAVSTGSAGNTMFLHTLAAQTLLGSDEGGASFQTRLTLPTNDQSGYDVAALSETMTLGYTINPKWSAEYVLTLTTTANKAANKQFKIGAPFHYGQISYSIFDKLQIYQLLGLSSADIQHVDQMSLGLGTGITYTPASWFMLDFGINQSHKVGSGATEFKLYNVEETKYWTVLVLTN